jgi:hypothetical protein
MRPIINNLTSNLTNQLIFSGSATPEPPPVTTDRTVLLEFDDLASIVATGDNVTQVNDKSGNGNNFTALSTPKINGFTQNSLNVVDLIEGDNSALVSGTIDMTNSFTFYCVAKVKKVNNILDTLVAIEDDLGNNISIVSNNAAKFDSAVVSNFHSTIIPADAPYEYNYMIYKYELDHLNNTATLSINGNQIGQVAYNGTMGTTATIKLGRDVQNVRFLEANLAEFMFYEGIVNPVDDAALISFFKNKWAILDPRNIADIGAYYDSSNIRGQLIGPALGGGFELNTLIDLSGNANNLDSTPLYRPIALSPTNKKNGLNAVEFDNIQKSMKALNFPVNNLDSSMTFVFVTNVIPVGITNFNQSVISWDQFPNDFNIESGSASNVFNCRADGSSTFHSNLTPTGTPYSGLYHVFIYKLDGVAGTASLIIDNVFRGQVNDYTSSLTQGDFYLNANKADQTQGLIQNFLEMMVIHDATSAAQDTEIYNYLKGKYDL